MKQEYASARYMLYEGLHGTRVHYSDRRVRLFDTLDYPMHSLATESVRTAYRIAYSLLDKIAFFVNHYWKLGKITDRINFKNVWMVENTQRLLDRFKEHSNWPLRGLFWLSKELFDEGLKQTTAPDARELQRYPECPRAQVPAGSRGLGLFAHAHSAGRRGPRSLDGQ